MSDAAREWTQRLSEMYAPFASAFGAAQADAWKWFDPDSYKQPDAWLERTMDAGRGLIEWLRASLPKDLKQADPQALTAAIKRFVDDAQALLRHGQAHGMPNLWQGLYARPGAFGNLAQPQMVEQWLKSAFGQWADPETLRHFPAFGYSRQRQEQAQQLLADIADFRGALDRYNALMLEASSLALDIFQAKLAERAEQGPKLTSLRAIYDLYVDAAEDAYATVALRDDFRHAYGALVNAQMRVKAGVKQQVATAAADVGIVTDGDVRGLADRVQAQARELRQLKAELRALKAQSPAAPTASPAESGAAEAPTAATKVRKPPSARKPSK